MIEKYSDMLSVVVCTRNRSELIEDCLRSLKDQATNRDFEVLVVDNNSTDNTARVVQKFDMGSIELQYILESEVGLSIARNRGYTEASFEWVAYIDDDAKAHPDFVEVACRTIEEEEFDCFGGIYNAWFKYGKPDWFPDNFGSNREAMPDEISFLDELNFSGGVAVYRKELLRQTGGFPTDMGMRGDTVGYGEEEFLQDRAREIGYKVGFNPQLQIDHLVLRDKLQKSWHYNAAFQKGKAQAKLQMNCGIDPHVLKFGILEIIKYPIRLFLKGTSFYGNRNLMYYYGYLSTLINRRNAEE